MVYLDLLLSTVLTKICATSFLTSEKKSPFLEGRGVEGTVVCNLMSTLEIVQGQNIHDPFWIKPHSTISFQIVLTRSSSAHSFEHLFCICSTSPSYFFVFSFIWGSTCGGEGNSSIGIRKTIVLTTMFIFPSCQYSAHTRHCFGQSILFLEDVILHFFSLLAISLFVRFI